VAQRILTLIAYLLRQLFFSLAGIIYVLVTLAFWRLFFDPTQPTPEPAYYVLMIGVFGAAAAFLLTLSVAARANQAFNYPILARLPSRVEHLTAVYIASLIATLVLQLLVSLLALVNGPTLAFSTIVELPPLWLAVDILSIALALHATDLVASGWSRVYVYGILAILLFGRQLDAPLLEWLSNQFYTAGAWFLREGYVAPGDAITTLAEWTVRDGIQLIASIFDAVFWPFRAISVAVIRGTFSPLQALAPAIIVLYSTLLFVLAADFFATKDVYLIE
jgi:hypothetical protein